VNLDILICFLNKLHPENNICVDFIASENNP
jgi:hypothetical protein